LNWPSKNAIDTVNSVSHFRDLVDGVYKVYSLSPKNQREIELIAGDLALELMKVQKVFDVRWVFSSFMSVTAWLRDLPALHAHFVELSSPSLIAVAKNRVNIQGLPRIINQVHIGLSLLSCSCTEEF